MQLVVDEFYKKNGRYPTFWIDKFCIDQNEPRWWFQIFYIFTPIFGEMIQFDVRRFFKWVGSTTN